MRQHQIYTGGHNYCLYKYKILDTYLRVLTRIILSTCFHTDFVFVPIQLGVKQYLFAYRSKTFSNCDFLQQRDRISFEFLLNGYDRLFLYLTKYQPIRKII